MHGFEEEYRQEPIIKAIKSVFHKIKSEIGNVGKNLYDYSTLRIQSSP